MAPQAGTNSQAALADTIERFATAWRNASTPPDLAAYLPTAPAARRASLIELIKIDLENRWTRDAAPKRLADYCAELPELRNAPLPPDLIYEEFVVRRRVGEQVEAADYTAEYPAQAAELSSLLATGQYDGTVASGPPVALDDVDVGQSIDDFDLMTSLGRGAFAKVFLARQRSMQRLVAVKISQDRGNEPQTLAQLDHDYIVRVFDQRILAGRKLRLLYMQYVPGGTLLAVSRRAAATPPAQRSGQLLLDVVDETLAANGEIRPAESTARAEIAALTWPETVAWLGRRLADALDYAGRSGVLHRDVKPANVLLTADGVPKLADFNISFSGNVSGSSPVAYFGGSLAYMSPEQLAVIHPDRPETADDLDTRSDLYSLAVVLWELLTGHKPFDDAGGSDLSDRTALDRMLRLRDSSSVPDPAELPSDCPTALRRVLLRALAPDPDDRWSSGGEMAQQLDICLDAHARDLVDPPPTSWRNRLRPFTHPIVALALAVPNLLAILYSYHHNRTLIIDKLDPAAQERFLSLTVATYVVSFVVGFALVTWLINHLFFVGHGLRKGRSYSVEELARARRETLLIGQRSAALCFALWAIAGIGIPLTVRLSGAEISMGTYVHFIASQLVCGAIALAYPFFLVSFYAVRCLYPIFLPHGEIGAADVAMLDRLDRLATVYLAGAAAIPSIGVAGATFIPAADIADVIVPIRVLCVGSIFAFFGAYWLFRLLEQDVRALSRIAGAG